MNTDKSDFTTLSLPALTLFHRKDRLTGAHGINNWGEIIVSIDKHEFSGSRAGFLLPKARLIQKRKNNQDESHFLNLLVELR